VNHAISFAATGFFNGLLAASIHDDGAISTDAAIL
jgi:hypothetical protein